MPAFDRNGPEGMGPMSGGGRGRCNSRRGNAAGRNQGSQFRGGPGRIRGNRNMFGGSGRSRGMGMNNRNLRNGADSDKEMVLLKEQAATLRQELSAIDKRLKDLESGDRTID